MLRNESLVVADSGTLISMIYWITFVVLAGIESFIIYGDHTFVIPAMICC